MSNVSKFNINGTAIDVKDPSARTPTFTEASTRANIVSGESQGTLFGKISKFFSDLKTVAFTGSYSDLSNKPTIPTAVKVISKTGTTDANGLLSIITSDISNTNNIINITNSKNSAHYILGYYINTTGIACRIGNWAGQVETNTSVTVNIWYL